MKNWTTLRKLICLKRSLGGGGLPEGYNRAPGLTLKNARYVITGFFLTGENTLRFRAGGASGNWIGAYNDASADDNFSFYGTTSATAKYARYNGQVGGSSIVIGTWYDVEISPTGVSGIRNPSTFTPATFTCSTPLCIGATSPTGTAAPNVSFEGHIDIPGRLRLIPCERVSDGVLGWHDGTNFYEPIIESGGEVTVLS